MTGAQVQAAWGPRHGVCRDCARTTWYFNRVRFRPEGAGVELRGGRVAAAFTLWKPAGWRTDDGLALGEPEARITEVYGALTRVECGGYAALTMPSGRAVTVFYVVRREPVGLRPHATERSSLPMSDATSGIASRIGIPHSGQSTW